VLDEAELLEVEKMITNIERTLDEMRKQALLEGRVEGRVEGKAEGKVEGKVEVAMIALKKGLPVQDVAEITGLSLETVLELKKELKKELEN